MPDFSVANSSRSKGLDGMKGNLWFSILKVIDLKGQNIVYLKMLIDFFNLLLLEEVETLLIYYLR